MILNIFKKKQIGKSAFIISIPKSGTYFLSEILKNVGLKQSYLHIAPNKYENYREANSFDEMRANYKKFKRLVPIQKSLKLIKPGEFAVGHIPYSYRALFDNFHTLFIKRNIQDVVVSYMNFIEFANRTSADDKIWLEETDPSKKIKQYLVLRGKSLLKDIRQIVDWNYDQHSLIVAYEALRSKESGPMIVDRISNFLNRIPNKTSIEILEKCLKSNTLTKSPPGYNKKNYWDKEAITIFNEFGGNEINKKLGYE